MLVNIIERQSHLEYTYHRIKWNDAKHTVRDGIVKKLSAAKQNLSIDKDIAAGIYVYALEELGKLLLLKDCKKVNGRYIIKYRNEFVSHQIN